LFGVRESFYSPGPVACFSDEDEDEDEDENDICDLVQFYAHII
jgi:hypothetical protein